jgi:hypothetical protein
MAEFHQNMYEYFYVYQASINQFYKCAKFGKFTTVRVEHHADHGKGIVYQLPQFVSTRLSSLHIYVHHTVTKFNIMIKKWGNIWPQNSHHSNIAFRNNGRWTRVRCLRVYSATHKINSVASLIPMSQWWIIIVFYFTLLSFHGAAALSGPRPPH